MIRFVSIIGASLLSCISMAAHAVEIAVERFVAFVMSVADPAPLALAGGTFEASTPTGTALDRALVNGLRHEAHVHRRSANRHC